MPILQNKSPDTRNKLKKLIILDFKIFTILVFFWLLFLVLAIFNYFNFKNILPVIFFVTILSSFFYYFFFDLVLIFKFKQKFRLWYFLFSLFIISPILFFFSMIIALSTADTSTDKAIFSIILTLLFIQYPIFHLISNLLSLKK